MNPRSTATRSALSDSCTVEVALVLVDGLVDLHLVPIERQVAGDLRRAFYRLRISPHGVLYYPVPHPHRPVGSVALERDSTSCGHSPPASPCGCPPRESSRRARVPPHASASPGGYPRPSRHRRPPELGVENPRRTARGPLAPAPRN